MPGGDVSLDLSAVSFIDSSGLKAIVSAAHKTGVPDCGGKLELVEDWLLSSDELEHPAFARETSAGFVTLIPRQRGP